MRTVKIEQMSAPVVLAIASSPQWSVPVLAERAGRRSITYSLGPRPRCAVGLPILA